MAEIANLIRTLFGEGDTVRDAGLTTPENIQRFDDIDYAGTGHPQQMLDVYRPKNVQGKLPVIVSVHGGGLVYGDKERYQYYCMELARFGFAVVNFSYRLAPETRFPAPFVDTNLVFQWVLDHAEKYGLDIDNLFAVGDSAGGFFLNIYATLLSNPEYAARWKDILSLPQGLKLRSIGLFCGNYQTKSDNPVSLPTPQGNVSNDALFEEFLPEDKSQWDEALSLMEALPCITKAYPPAYVMTASHDFLREQAMLIVQKLFEKDVPFEFQYFSKDEPLYHVFHLNIRSEDAKKANASLAFYFLNQIEPVNKIEA